MAALTCIYYVNKPLSLRESTRLAELHAKLASSLKNYQLVIVSKVKPTLKYDDTLMYAKNLSVALKQTDYSNLCFFTNINQFFLPKIDQCLSKLEEKRVVCVVPSIKGTRIVHTKHIPLAINLGIVFIKKDYIEQLVVKDLHAFTLSKLLKYLLSLNYRCDCIYISLKKYRKGYNYVVFFILRIIHSWFINTLDRLFFDIPILVFKRLDILSKGHGFYYKGTEFVNHTKLHYLETAFFRVLKKQQFLFAIILILTFIGLYLDYLYVLQIVVLLLTLLYFFDLLFNLLLVFLSLRYNPQIKITKKQVSRIHDWPTYTIFSPLYKEYEVLPQFVKAIENLDYPKDKLQVLLLLEEDDLETIAHARSMSLPNYFVICIVPNSTPKTKPKACNFGLYFATGKYSVIYDAEDIPDPLQLKKSVIAFDILPKRVVCVQAKLNFYNPTQNLLSKLFTLEYSTWFDLVLPGLQYLNAPIPLGGTSNHFKTKYLRKLHGWDAFNVTEDCDLGIRLFKKGYNTALLDSTTYEEANVATKNWVKQRSRWIKGYIQSYFVHTRNVSEFRNKTSFVHFFTFNLVVGGKTLSVLINPIMWLLTIVYFTNLFGASGFIQDLFPSTVLYIGVFSLIVGNFIYIYLYLLGSFNRGYYSLIKYAVFVPFYWLFMSFSSLISIYELIKRPHYWSKTKHGLHLNK